MAFLSNLISMHTAKAKLLNLGLILSSFIGYLEWGTDQSGFLIETEWMILSGLFTDPMSVLHPFTVIPLLGQILLVITLFQKTPDRKLSYVGLSCLSLLLLFIPLIGVLAMNLKIFASALPFIMIGILTLMHLRKKPPEPPSEVNNSV